MCFSNQQSLTFETRLGKGAGSAQTRFPNIRQPHSIAIGAKTKNNSLQDIQSHGASFPQAHDFSHLPSCHGPCTKINCIVSLISALLLFPIFPMSLIISLCGETTGKVAESGFLSENKIFELQSRGEKLSGKSD